MERLSYGSVSLVRQGEHVFYSLTLPTEILAKTCFVIDRVEDPIEGFQRELDKKRAKEIADYIDSGLGTIPSSIVLSAQQITELEYDSKKKSISFSPNIKSFLIIDGQHRVFGFMMAKTAFRVPVVIYEGLSKRDETRLFIDINSKQKGVPPELLLDIKKMADYENDQEEFLREVYDTFRTEQDSFLMSKMTPAKKEAGKISRSLFNSAVKPLIKFFGAKSTTEIYNILNSYLIAFDEAVLKRQGIRDQMFTPTVLKAIVGFFPIAAAKSKDRFGSIYTPDNFNSVLEIVGERLKKVKIEQAANSYKPLIDHFEECLRNDFSL
ncbi:MAG: hypothetical protein A2076_04415 [Geobacteraceae bacterium GWC2_53_11]|nr:MAG: hypothetical protein A2076_04415 [Geobacteraceae bacterium GWC2_53_11]